ncbi:MAG: S8 family serine peptidase [Sphingomonas sp.]|uniref:S8 family serine peptidase n=1 Tax=Sphingomonas sp. TaxID=28214 RepID=UPI0025DC0956|nr:S8 family serine peptidase [Sphingomonas sp.]MBX3564146.1 S8 family serine peptidase [Sphingomonas sp.]
MRTLALLFALALAGLAAPAQAQLVPGVPVGDALRPVAPVLDRVAELPRQAVSQLETARLDRIAKLVRDHPQAIGLDPNGFPARAHEVVVSDPSDAMVKAAAGRGFRLIERDTALDVGFARFETPRGMPLKRAIRALREMGAREVDADQLHFQSGAAASTGTIHALPFQQGGGPFIGMIDGGVGGGGMIQRGFASGGARASDHGTAIASLILGRGPVRGAAPGARLIVADVYGSDPAGGSATAIAKALGWLVEQGAPVAAISLVGPQNALLARVIAAAQARGMIVVAAVGNDGPAAPYAYPASYPGVIAVTGVDARNRLLIEAGRSTHLDYAAPGADMLAINAAGAPASVRGTSFAVPLVAARIALAYPRLAPAVRPAALRVVDGQAQPLGKRYGRGVVCGTCRTPPR